MAATAIHNDDDMLISDGQGYYWVEVREDGVWEEPVVKHRSYGFERK